jgi:alpha-2-macroglobulin
MRIRQTMRAREFRELMMQAKTLMLATLALFAAPIAALSSGAPQVVLATPGSAGANGGAIERFTMRFSEAMVPLGDPRATPPATMKCPVGSTGRWVDPQTFVFDFEKALPGGISCTVDLTSKLTSARGVSVAGAQTFTIDTGGPSARAVLPGGYGDDIEEGQVFLVATNVVPSAASVAANGYCSVDGIGEKIALDVLKPEVVTQVVDGLGPDNWNLRNFLESAGLPQAMPANAADKAKALATVVAVKCRRPLAPGRDMALVWDAAIAGADGRTAARDQRFDFTVRKAFAARWECSRVNPQAGCNPVSDANVRFSADIPMEQAKAIRLTFADGTVREPVIDKDSKSNPAVSDLTFKGPFPAAMAATVSIPAGIKDASGRVLENAERFPLAVKFDVAPPLVKFAAPFGIIEAKEGGVLPVTVRAVEPQLAQRVLNIGGTSLKVDGSDGQVAEWLRRLDDADDSDFREEPTGEKDETKTVNYTGTTSLLEGQGNALKLGLPGAGKEFEVVGIPLTKPGFYVVELASPTLGNALLGRNVPRYVAAGALVTNMAVHFKWGRESSLAWVTSLDSGKPVGGAAVRVSDSCTGKVLATGTSDAQGRVPVGEGLYDPETYGSCDSSAHPLMVSARAGDDFSFTMTTWGEGIRPYDFDLPYGYSAPDDILHTIFDRPLMRAGETVSMKHILRRPVGGGFEFPEGLEGTLRLQHRGSDTQFDQPIKIGGDGVAESSWTAPKGAPMGDYDLSVIVGDRTISTNQSVRVDEFRLPTMRATISGPKEAVVRPTVVPLSLFVGYLSGGGASNLPVAIRTAFSTSENAPEGWDGWTFGGDDVKEGTTPLDGDGNAPDKPIPLSQTLPVTLKGDGTAQTSVEINQTIDATTAMTVEMDYQDANGETLTASQSVILNPSAVRLGIKTDGWLMRDSDLRLKFAAIGVNGVVKKGQRVAVALFSRETITARRRLIGGFYAYDNQEKVTKLGASCSVTTDAQGLAGCTLNAGVSGNVTVVATTADDNGNVARAVTSVWLAGEDDWWFGGDNGDRMDVIPEAKSYKAGETAKLQVRMPFRSATALVTVEREGVLSSFVTNLSGKDPVISVPMPAAYAPDVYVSVMAVRGRIGGFKLWLSDFAKRWHLPFFSREGGEPTALVDLSKPSYRLGIAKVQVGWEGHALAVNVKADKAKYAVRETAQVDVSVKQPDGKPAASAEIAFAAVDEALLQLKPNESWKLLDAVMGERSLEVLTATGQTQVVGKRHYGKKAVEAGGGGGDESAATRDDFRPVLLWKGRVQLDANGHARIPVPLSESLSAFKLVAIATSGAQLFGTGETSVRTAQDLTVFSALPPLVRTGDYYGASFTLRNGSDKPMQVTATVKVNPSVAIGKPLTVTIPAGGAVPVTWNLPAPAGVSKLDWTVEAKSTDGKVDTLAASQDVIPSVPIEVWAATLTRVGPNTNGATSIPIAPPNGALAGGYVDVKLSASLAPPLAGVRAYMTAYPYNCFEQQLSRAVALGDAGMWGGLAGEIPAYMDRDGLLRYFPMERIQGSEALTAYALSMTAEAGFPVPEAAKAKMIEALKAVVEGRLKRDWNGPTDQRLLKVASLAALARNGASSAALVGAIDIAPADMPTATLADWMVAIDRTNGLANAPALRGLAEQTLRRRIVYEGSRVDLTDANSAPWWMMVSIDESALKALSAILGRPGWGDEAPKMMVGAALRQLRGHWDTTPANAWGAIVARRFTALYPASAITGTTTVALGPVSRTQSWPMASGAGPLRLPLVQAPLTLSQSGGAGPWAAVSVSAAVPLVQPLFAGYRMTKQTSIVSQKNKGWLTRGDVIKVSIEVEATAERTWVVISDPVPPGATIIGDLGGQSAILGGQGDATGGGGQVLTLDGQKKPLIIAYGVQPAYVERGRDAWRGYFEWVPAGKFAVSYVMRLNGTGRFNLPPTRVEAMYSPDIRAQVPNKGLQVRM